MRLGGAPEFAQDPGLDVVYLLLTLSANIADRMIVTSNVMLTKTLHSVSKITPSSEQPQ